MKAGIGTARAPHSQAPTAASYKVRKERLLHRLRVRWLYGWALAGAAVLVGVLRWVPQVWWEPLSRLGGKGGKAGEVAGQLGLAELVPLVSMAGAVLTACLVIARARHGAARFLYQRLFDEFNDDVFLPVRRPGTEVQGQTPLPWVEPSAALGSTDRLHVWNELGAWVVKGSDMGTDGTAAVPFSWALLVGRPGAGKSRTADEFARLLARRDMLGNAASLDRTFQGHLRRARLRIGATWRRARRRPLPDDPWDAGRPAHRRGAGHELIADSADYKGCFDLWQPRAPTLIVFEDPRAEEAAHLIRWLTAKLVPGGRDATEMPYKFPVRLLIVNQTLPADLKLQPGSDGRWNSQLPHMGVTPWLVNERSYLGTAEWKALLRRRFGADDWRRWGVPDADFQRLTRGGHPLLLESLVQWLDAQTGNQAPDLSQVTSAHLLRDRADRVLLALQAAGIDGHAAWRVLAAATLAGGLPRQSEDAGRPAPLDAAALQRVFPSEDVQQRIPAIRPDLIGHAFCEALVERPREEGVLPPASDDAQDITAQQIAVLAWQGDAYGALRTLDRLLDDRANPSSGRPRPARRRLVRALEDAPVQASGIDPAVVARAFARLHLLHGRSLATLRTWLAHAPAAAALRLATVDLFDFLDVAEDVAAARDVMAVYAAACERALAPGAPAVEASAAQDLLDALLRLAGRLEDRGDAPGPADHLVPAAYARLGAALAREKRARPSSPWAGADALTQAFHQLWLLKLVRLHGLAAFAGGCLLEDPCSRAPDALHWLARAVLAGLEPASQAALTFEDDLAALQAQPDAVAALPVLVAGWTRCAYAHAEADRPKDTEACVQHLLRLEDLWGTERPHAAPARLQAPALAVTHAATAYGRLRCPQDAERCARQITAWLHAQASALPVANRREIEDSASLAWASAVYAYLLTDQFEAAQACDAELEALVRVQQAIDGAPALRLAQRQAESWSRLAWSHGTRRQGHEAEACAHRIAERSQPFQALPATRRMLLAEHQAGAWLHAAAGYAANQQLDDSVRCAQALQVLAEALAEVPPAERQVLALRQAGAWRQAAIACNRASQRQAAEDCARRCQQVAESLSMLPVAERAPLVTIAAKAWSDAAAVGGAPSPGRTERHAEIIDRLLAGMAELPLEGRLALLETAVGIWGLAAVAHGQEQSVEGARRCFARSTQLAALGDGLPLADRAALASGAALGYTGLALALARKRRPRGVEEVAEAMQAVAAQYDTLPPSRRGPLALWQAEIWAMASGAWAESGDLAQARHCTGRMRTVMDPWRGRADEPNWTERTRSVDRPAS